MQSRWVARECVQLATYRIIEERAISEDVRSEQLDIDMTRHMEDDHG